MTRGWFIAAAILFGLGLGLELLAIDRYSTAFLFAGLLSMSVGHAV